MWYEERNKKDRRPAVPNFSICCRDGQVQLPLLKKPPELLRRLLDYNGGPSARKFRENIRTLNSMFAFTSMGGSMDNRINDGRGPYCFLLNGQNHHLIGSLLPEADQSPNFMQLYVADTKNEVRNRMRALNKDAEKENLDPNIIQGLQDMFDEHNPLTKVLRMARDRFKESDYVPVQLRFISTRGKDGRQYNLPTTSEVAALIVGDGQQSRGTRDVIIEERDGFRTDIPRNPRNGSNIQEQRSKRQFISLREYHAYRMQNRLNEAQTLISGGRLYHQHIVHAFTCIEESNLRWVRNNKKKLRSELYKGLRDVVVQGDTMPGSVGKRFVLPSSFTGGPKYMVQNYQDAMAICRYYGPPNIFLTFTCNPKWPEIQRCVDLIPGQKVEDRPHVVARVFKIKLDELMKDLRQRQHIGRVLADIVSEVDEIKRYLDARYVSASEASWRIFEFDIQYRNPGVERLSFHLLDQQPVIFDDEDHLDDVLNREGIEKTMFTEWMQTNKDDPSAKELTYSDFPTKYVWHAKDKKWRRRKSGRCIGRIYYSHPSSGENFYLRMLLNIVKGPECHDDIKTVNGALFLTYKEACNAFGLLGNDDEWHRAIQEAAHWQTGRQLRELFVTMILFCEVAEPLKLWERNWEIISDDILYRQRRILGITDLNLNLDQLKNYVLQDIEQIMNANNRSLKEFPYLPFLENGEVVNLRSRLLTEELCYDKQSLLNEHAQLYNGLNADQLRAYTAVIDAVQKGKILSDLIFQQHNMESISNASCEDDCHVPVRATFVNLYNCPESGVEFVKSISFTKVRKDGHNSLIYGHDSKVVDRFSSRQLFLISYPLTREEDNTIIKCVRWPKEKAAEDRIKRNSGGDTRRKCARLRSNCYLAPPSFR
ncbi:hypothetical protein BUALT_Bualt13G0107200 [Buddleja alternifolia]|uniref:Helitron helicase-like domain-containing protein n=1 Tax=Buddleja alternifolia TaxID=168488 RepID=A0AAV6WX95_9LAMI|nr:hypothetical protein BUALT_Bualt13G0107200 [Buddleja alternifolia]